MKRIVFERKRLLQIGKLLIVEAGRFAQDARHHGPSHRVVFVGEAALEGHEQVATTANIVDQLVEQSVGSNIERRNNNDLVIRKVRAVGKYKVNTNILLVERVIHLAKDGTVIFFVAELHEFDAVV